MNAEEALREIGKICERVGEDCHKKLEMTYSIGDVIEMSTAFGVNYYIISEDIEGAFLLNLSSGVRRMNNGTLVSNVQAISKQEMVKMRGPGTANVVRTTLRRAADGIGF